MQLNKKILTGFGIIVIAILLIILGIFFFSQNFNKANVIAMNYDFTVIAEKDDNTGVDIDSGFIITSNEDYSLETVKDIIKMEPQVDYEITKKGSGNYYLKTKSALKNNAIYNICAINENEPDILWAFQTQADFAVMSTLPTNKAEEVPVNTGIEIMFSKTPGDIQKYFTITPNVKGKFETNGKKVSFIPSSSLLNNTEYTIKISSDFQSIDGTKLNNDYIYKFTTAKISNLGNIYITNGYNETFTTKDTQLLELRVQKGDFSKEKFYVDIYDLESAENYIKQIKNIENGLINIKGFNKISNFETTLIKQSNNNFYDNHYIVFPENLSQGWYLVDVTTGIGVGDTKNQHLQKLIQVTDISVYVQSYNTETVIWCNDVDKGIALNNAVVNVENIKEVTNVNGVAIVYIDTAKKVPLYITAPDGRKFAEYLYLSEKEKSTIEDTYYMYFYTDREDYMSTDIINYWGVILPKKSNAVVPKSLELIWRDEKIDVPISSSGSFSGKIEFSKLVSNYYPIKLRINNLEIYVSTVEISEYIKPTYILNSSFDKLYYKAGDNAEITVNGTFFDGTPAEGLQLNANINSEERKITLGNNGDRNFSYQVYKDTSDWRPSYLFSNIHTTGNDEDAKTYSFAHYFPSSYMFEADWKDEKLFLESNKINFNNIVDENINYDRLKGSYADASGSINIIKNKIVKTETGTYYDYINKLTKKKYSYKTEKTLIDTFSFKTVNGKASINMNYPEEDDVYYTAEIKYVLADGFEGKTDVTRYFYDMNKNDYDYKQYSFKPNADTYTTKEEAFIELVCNNEKVTTDGRMLYSVLQDNIKDVAVTKNNDFTVTFTEVYIPNVTICGAYFDGSKIYPINSCNLCFNTNERNLDVKIATDKENYKPGETVTMSVEVKDKFGKTYPTNLVMSVVDEAAFAVQEQYVDPLSSLYVYKTHSPNQYVSYIQHTDFVNAEGGEDGVGDIYRSNFEDTAAFITITTGSNGKTTASFKLPDNITSWRITAIGITNNVSAGYNTKNITTSLPFFINPVINQRYTSNDSVSFTVRCAGKDKANIKENVKYTAIIKGNSFEKTISIENNVNEMVAFDFGMLSEGEYDISIKATAGKYSDGINKKIYVIDSLHEIIQTKDIDLSKEIDINAVKFPVNLVFYNEENVLYYNNIEKILSTSYGITSEQKIARNIVMDKLNNLTDKQLYNLSEVIGIQDYSGGVKLLDYSDTDTLLTAKLCALAPQYIDTVKAKSYFENIINNSSSSSADLSAAYFGLAALKEPVVNDIKYLLNNNKGFSERDNINLISGLACIGDINGANEWYVKLLSKNIKEKDEIRYIQIGNSEENYEATSNLIIPLTKMNHSDLTLFMEYVLKYNSDKYSPALDLTSYLLEFNPVKSEECCITYELNGKQEKIDLDKKVVENLLLTEDELKSFKVMDFNRINCKAIYSGGITDIINEANNKITVEKIIEGSTKVGETVTTTLKVKFPTNAQKNTDYILTDVIPTGMRYTGYNKPYNSRYYLTKHEAQKVYFTVSNKDNSEIIITYNARNLLPGEYLVDCAVIENYNENMKGYSTFNTCIIE